MRSLAGKDIRLPAQNLEPDRRRARGTIDQIRAHAALSYAWRMRSPRIMSLQSHAKRRRFERVAKRLQLGCVLVSKAWQCTKQTKTEIVPSLLERVVYDAGSNAAKFTTNASGSQGLDRKGALPNSFGTTERSYPVKKTNGICLFINPAAAS